MLLVCLFYLFSVCSAREGVGVISSVVQCLGLFCGLFPRFASPGTGHCLQGKIVFLFCQGFVWEKDWGLGDSEVGRSRQTVILSETKGPALLW